MEAVGFIIGFELFPLVALLAVVGSFVGFAMYGPHLFHMIPWWGPALVGAGIPGLALLVVQFLWRRTSTREVTLGWLYATTFFLGPGYLYLGYWCLQRPWLLILGYGLLSLYILPWIVLAPIGTIMEQLDESE